MRRRILVFLGAALFFLGNAGNASADDDVFDYSGGPFGQGTQTLTLRTLSGQTLIFATSTNEFLPGVRNQGWWTDVRANFATNQNYGIGRDDLSDGPPKTNYHGFFSFDLLGLAPTDPAVSATLDLTKFMTYSNTGTPFEALNLWDVSTPANVLAFHTSINPAIYNDLGSGKNYGAFAISVNTTDLNNPVIDPTVLHFDLNANALADINSASGGFFSIGGSVPEPVPEPASLILAGVGATLALGYRWRRERSPARQPG